MPTNLRGCGPFAEAAPAEVRAALIDEETGEFDEQWRRALAAAAETLDLGPVMQVLDSWRRRAWLQQDPDDYRRMLVEAAEILAGEKLPPELLAATKARLASVTARSSRTVRVPGVRCTHRSALLVLTGPGGELHEQVLENLDVRAGELLAAHVNARAAALARPRRR